LNLEDPLPDPPPPAESKAPAKKAVKPTTSHLRRSNGLKRAFFILSHPRDNGLTYSIFIFPPWVCSTVMTVKSGATAFFTLAGYGSFHDSLSQTIGSREI
jgi:hypothetical protein